MASVFALLGVQQYFINYANLAQEMYDSRTEKEEASKLSLLIMKETLNHLAHKAAKKPFNEGC